MKKEEDNVVPLHEPKSPLVGPFTVCHVVVEGRQIPLLTGLHEGDHTALIVDRRFSVSVPNAYAERVAWLLANAIAVASGYAYLGSANKDMPFAPQVTELKLP